MENLIKTISLDLVSNLRLEVFGKRCFFVPMFCLRAILWDRKHPCFIEQFSNKKESLKVYFLQKNI